MNIRCPQCQTVFKVDPARIPQGGARARCARCGTRFMVRPPATSPPVDDAKPAASQPQPRPAPSRYGSQAPAAAGQAPAQASPAAAVANRSRPAEPAVPAAGSRDPNSRAERLARALVSDIVAYHPDRRERSLSDGTLRTEFRDEIMKSWDEYVAQVGLPMAKSTPYFRDALNKILAKGQQIF